MMMTQTTGFQLSQQVTPARQLQKYEQQKKLAPGKIRGPGVPFDPSNYKSETLARANQLVSS